MGFNPSYFSSSSRPVDQVSWYDAVNFCNLLSMQAGYDSCYIIEGTDVSCDFYATGYRLPTESEWEFAARGGTISKGYKYSGNNDPNLVAWYQVNSSDSTHAMGTKQPNELDLYDMNGNILEWCWDWYTDYTSTSKTNPTGPASGVYHVLRGGSLLTTSQNLRIPKRFNTLPAVRNLNNGFRVVRR
jgi:sulfatase modifying factor 1